MKILIVDDETNIQKTTAVALKAVGHLPISAYSGNQALRKLAEEKIDAVFLDLNLGGENGIDVFDRIIAEGYDIPVIMFTAYASIETAIEATRKGIYDYVQKPFVPEQIRLILKKLEEEKNLRSKIDKLTEQLGENKSIITFESADPKMQEVYEVALKAAKSDANILLLGPSGTGKTVLANHIHENSNRGSSSFVVIHSPSLSRELLESELFGHTKGSFTGAIRDTWGKVEAADNGTLFLDEIGDLPVELQAKLLRLLQEKEYERVGETKTRTADVRIIAATNKNLHNEVKAGRFRQDLFYRLNVISLELPGLIDRKADMESLIDNYIKFYGKKMGLKDASMDQAAKSALLAYDWPGNLRELSNVIERCIILITGNTIQLEDLPQEIRFGNLSDGDTALQSNIGGNISLKQLEDEHIKRILSSADSMDKAAKTLGIDTATLYRKRKKLGLL